MVGQDWPGPPDELERKLCKLLRSVLTEEMSRPGQADIEFAFRARHAFLEDAVPSPCAGI
jgi:hypothetical protein